MKPMTASEILEWAEQAGPVESLLGKPVKDADWATAKHLSYCMRVTAAVESMSKLPSGVDSDIGPWTRDVLFEAAKEQNDNE